MYVAYQNCTNIFPSNERHNAFVNRRFQNAHTQIHEMCILC